MHAKHDNKIWDKAGGVCKRTSLDTCKNKSVRGGLATPVPNMKLK